MSRDARLHVGTGLTDLRQTGRARREARQRSAAMTSQARRAQREAEAADRAAQKVPDLLPPHGEPRPWALRMPFAGPLLAHRDNTDTLAAAYPFVADGGLGVPGWYIGDDAFTSAAFEFDPFALYAAGVITNPNGTITGNVGAGKSTTSKVMALAAILHGVDVSIASDPKGEWTNFVRSFDRGSVFRLVPGGHARMNPLDSGVRPARTIEGEPMTDTRWIETERHRRLALVASISEALLTRSLDPVERSVLDDAVDLVVRGSGNRPRLPEVVGQLLNPAAENGVVDVVSTLDDQRHIGQRIGASLRRLTNGDLAGMFDDYSTETFDPSAPISSVDMSALGVSHQGLPIAQACADAWLEAAIRNPDSPRRMVFYEEGWGRTQHASLLERMREQWKLARYFGISNWLVLHRDSDMDTAGDAGTKTRSLATGLLEDTSIRIVHRQPQEAAAAVRAATGMSSEETALLPRLARGRALWRINNRPFLVDTRYHPDLDDLFDTNKGMTG